MLCLSHLPYLLAARNRRKRLLVILRLALLAEVVVWYLVVIVGHSHANVVLPGKALVTADHRTLVFLVFLDVSADAAYNGLFLLFFGLGCLGLAASASFLRWWVGLIGFGMLTFGRATGSANFFCSID